MATPSGGLPLLQNFHPVQEVKGDIGAAAWRDARRDAAVKGGPPPGHWENGELSHLKDIIYAPPIEPLELVNCAQYLFLSQSRRASTSENTASPE